MYEFTNFINFCGGLKLKLQDIWNIFGNLPNFILMIMKSESVLAGTWHFCVLCILRKGNCDGII